MNEEINTEAKTILEAGAALSIARGVGDHPYAVVPDNYSVESLEKFLPSPLRHEGSFVFFDADSFIAYVNKMKGGQPAASLYCIMRPSPSFKAVFDDHTAEKAGWGDFTAEYKAPTSVEWNTWVGQDSKGMNQEEFAQFVERNLPDVVNPTAADFLEISRTLEAKKAVNFKSAIRLSDGKNQFTYEEDIKGTAANGRLDIPEVFTLGIPVLEGGPRYAVEARLRYRIKDGKLVLWYELVRAHKVMEDAANEVRQYIADNTGMTLLHASV